MAAQDVPSAVADEMWNEFPWRAFGAGQLAVGRVRHVPAASRNRRSGFVASPGQLY